MEEGTKKARKELEQNLELSSDSSFLPFLGRSRRARLARPVGGLFWKTHEGLSSPTSADLSRSSPPPQSNAPPPLDRNGRPRSP
ncbi:hypothetical protein M6B38_232565 [Iris pallida]|uniref:Uncharacterized protein n=1 Tax=Iris pallida TaxID=29817 RepID=A0AAX6DRI2_IRIPA|nr:hypothetical protein M6B38_232565 [Iris pallida]